MTITMTLTSPAWKALDNKLCLRSAYPGEWQSAEHELGGRFSLPCSALSALTLGHPPPALEFLQEGMGFAMMLKPVAERRVLEQRETPALSRKKRAKIPPSSSDLA